jgi:hypothetical protein
MEVLMLEIDNKLINFQNMLFACSEGDGVTKITFVDGRAITVNQDYKIVKMAILKFARS